MQSERVVCLRDHPELADAAAKWFHQKWGVPQEAYAQSISECLQKNTAVPQWYLVINRKEIIAGIGVIENDFHNRKDLAPNVCAVYVEEAYRNRALRAECCNLYVMIYKPEALIRFISSQTSLPSMNGMGGNFCVWLRETVSKRYPGYIYTKACAEKTAQAFLHISGLRAFPRTPSRVQQPFAGPLGKERSRPSYLRRIPTFSGQ